MYSSHVYAVCVRARTIYYWSCDIFIAISRRFLFSNHSYTLPFGWEWWANGGTLKPSQRTSPMSVECNRWIQHGIVPWSFECRTRQIQPSRWDRCTIEPEKRREKTRANRFKDVSNTCQNGDKISCQVKLGWLSKKIAFLMCVLSECWCWMFTRETEK